jgi:hypothetical protein
MKSLTNLFIALFFILGVVRVTQSQDYSVQGKVRYSDNNEFVSSGVVRFYDLNGTLEATGQIGEQGDYMLYFFRHYEGDLIGTPNTEPEDDFVPTGYPDKIDPNQFVHVSVDGHISGIDIYVTRIPSSRPNQELTTVRGFVSNNGMPVKDAIVYAQSGDQYLGFGISNAKGEYSIINIPVGDYILVAHKIGSQSDNKSVTLGEEGMDNLVFNVTPNKNLITTVAPESFSLSQNFPNPFNPSTVINYSVSKDGFVSLKVYNNIGQQVAELMNGVQGAGEYNAVFNAAGLPSGIYFYKLEANGFTDTKKMILVK